MNLETYLQNPHITRILRRVIGLFTPTAECNQFISYNTKIARTTFGRQKLPIYRKQKTRGYLSKITMMMMMMMMMIIIIIIIIILIIIIICYSTRV